MCWVILRGQQIYTVLQAVHSLLYIVAKCHFFSVVTWKDIIKCLQTCEGCTHFCEILYVHFACSEEVSCPVVRKCKQACVRKVQKKRSNGNLVFLYSFFRVSNRYEQVLWKTSMTFETCLVFMLVSMAMLIRVLKTWKYQIKVHLEHIKMCD